MMRGSVGVLEILNTLKSLILLDVKSLMGVLVWPCYMVQVIKKQ